MDLQQKAKDVFRAFYNETSEEKLEDEDVYVVWFSKVLKNWKALVSTTVPDNMYYELTYDGDAKKTYIDIYQKSYNVVVDD